MKRKNLPQEQSELVTQITDLHSKIISHLRQSLQKAIKIGELLTEQKKSLRHGEWGPWIKRNLPFSDQTARNYMKLHHHRDTFKIKNVLNLTEAYRLLSEEKKPKGIMYTEKEAEEAMDYFLNNMTPDEIVEGRKAIEERVKKREDEVWCPDKSVNGIVAWTNKIVADYKKILAATGTVQGKSAGIN